MLGHKLVQVLSDELDVVSTIRGGLTDVKKFGIFHSVNTIEHINVGEYASYRKAIEAAKPDVVINAAGIIKQLPSSKNVVDTLTINSIFPHKLAELSEEFHFRLICISTDCVFSGNKGNYTEDDQPDALDLYGQSKHFGEVIAENCLTIRTSIIGPELSTSHSLLEWFLSNRGGAVKGYTNAIFSGFPTVVFADILKNLIVNRPELHGLYHVSSDPVNKFDLLNMINRSFGADVKIEPDLEYAIDRSLDSRKFSQATGFIAKGWEDMIELMAADAEAYSKWRK